VGFDDPLRLLLDEELGDAAEGDEPRVAPELCGREAEAGRVRAARWTEDLGVGARSDRSDTPRSDLLPERSARRISPSNMRSSMICRVTTGAVRTGRRVTREALLNSSGSIASGIVFRSIDCLRAAYAAAFLPGSGSSSCGSSGWRLTGCAASPPLEGGFETARLLPLTL
jgi:hypothetical protein